MLKTLRDDKAWLVTQPDHAEVSGYLAAHWGNEEFSRPGYYADSPDPERLGAETVLAIAEHDNGWWEWEAAPEISAEDGLPLGLSEFLKNPREGIGRWQRGIPRFNKDHPYVSLLLSYHAYWLYYRGIDAESEPTFTHQLFSKGPPVRLKGDALEITLKFIAEIEEMQSELTSRLAGKPETAGWLKPEHLNPHVRLLQILDGLSLSLCSDLIFPRKGEAKGFGEDEIDFPDVPRRNWEDRVGIELRPRGEGRIVCQPYPFDRDPLPVYVPARIPDLRGTLPIAARQHSWWLREPKQLLRYEYCSA